MAEAVVSVALETLRDLLLEEARLLSGVGDEVKALQTQLIDMESLLEDAEGKQHESESVSNWIAKIRDLAYRSEDVIETFAAEVSLHTDLKKVFACPNLQQLKINIEIGRLHQCRNEVISSSLLKLYLTDCEIEDDPMEILGKLPSLKQLHLLSRSFVGEEMVCSAFSFPKLKELELNKLPMLRQWRVEHGAMPCVMEIEMVDCPHLQMD